MQQPVKYIATIAPVREISLVGSSDLGYWHQHLQGTGLFPWAKAEQAEVILSAIASTWQGLRFREMTCGLQVCLREGSTAPDGLYFLAAFNSSRFLAFCERFFFHTPYVRAKLEVREQAPAACQLSRGTETLLRVEMGTARPPLRQEPELWEGAIYLPNKQGPGSDKLFYARLSGDTAVYPFIAGDLVNVAPTPQYPVLQWLTEARFVGKEWHLRTAGVHARSKTFRRTEAANAV